MWIVGPMTDQRNSIGTHYTDRAMGMLERLTGARLAFSAPDRGAYIKASWQDGATFTGNLWFEINMIQVKKIHLSRSRDFILRSKGKEPCDVFSCGTWPDFAFFGKYSVPDDLKRIFTLALDRAGVKLPKITGRVGGDPAQRAAGDGLILAEIGNHPASIALEEK